ncbi:FAD-dependent monooxygenase [Pseudonocardia spinosispora]|uniref:FAD-dependent monooxygenase n=1 Tax=Pseudonocardia spinosispora TaxID=103441 RepID=UPI001FDEB123|nr:FAD-dependent monooxygenase [Pseudonocardia spinosispora]
MTSPFLVIGGGIGGLAAALALARAGHRTRVLERAPEFGEVGAGLQVGPNASRVLDRLGVLDAVTTHAFFPTRLTLRDALTGERLTSLATGDAFRELFGYRYFVAHRADLHRTVLTACEETGLVELLPDKEVLEVRPRRGGAVVRCADGSEYSTYALVAADGVHSPTRRLLIGDGAPTDSGYVAYRGTVPMEVLARHGGLPEPDGMVIWAGPGLHLVQYPVRRGELCNQVATIDTRRYTEHAGDLTAQLRAAFDQACPDVRTGIQLMDTTRRWSLLDRPPATGWSQGAITLVGDAAHPMLQYLAQGACQAIEDSVALADSVDEHPDDIAAAFRAYEARRAPRTARVQSTARDWGEVLHVDGIGGRLRAALLADRAEDDYQAVEWLYGFDAAGTFGHTTRELSA